MIQKWLCQTDRAIFIKNYAKYLFIYTEFRYIIVDNYEWEVSYENCH